MSSPSIGVTKVLFSELDDVVRHAVALVLAILDLLYQVAAVGIVLEQVEQELRRGHEILGRAVEQRVELARLRDQADLGHTADGTGSPPRADDCHQIQGYRCGRSRCTAPSHGA